MNSTLTGIAAAVCALMVAGPALAEIHSPAGLWTTGPKDSRYEITLCGDGDDMCGTLVWAKDTSPEVSRYLNTTVLDTARRVGNQEWYGVTNIAGNRFRGTLTLVSRDQLHIKACNGLVCGEFNLYRE